MQISFLMFQKNEIYFFLLKKKIPWNINMLYFHVKWNHKQNYWADYRKKGTKSISFNFEITSVGVANNI